MKNKSFIWNLISWIFGMIVIAIGLINVFWGNDPGFGVFVLLLSVIYFLPANALPAKLRDSSIPLIVKIVVGLFILWASLGVGELFDKIDLMMNSF
jgi:hypothetical protein